MDPIKFRVIGPREAKPKGSGPMFVLRQDNWNDYGFHTQYQFYFYRDGPTGKRDEDLIGSVKILKRGQTSGDPLPITTDFPHLGAEYCSVGESLDYYERMSSLGTDIRDQVLLALRDVVHNPSLVDEFSDEDGWSTSLFRSQKDVGAEFRLLAAAMMSGNYTSLPADDLKFSFQVPGWQQAVGFTFEGPRVGGDDFFGGDKLLPERIAVVVGRNGSGKSTLLARLARVAFGSVAERGEEPLRELGQMEPNGIGFPRIVNITFSPFDSFRMPGSDLKNRKQVAKDVAQGEGRFVFIGLRDIASEPPQPRSKVAKQAESIPELAHLGDRLERTVLKSIDQLANEFDSFIGKIREKNRTALLNQVLETLLFDSPIPGISPAADAGVFPISRERAGFFHASTGHKIVLLIASGLIAHIEPRSLVLIDEPETHLHPPLLAALMHALRRILEAHKAFAVVATHSPVVAQESLARHVKVIRREGDMTQVSPVRIETFGESVGLISSEVFGLQSEATDFHKVLDQIVTQVDNLEAIEALFQDGVMSHQARAYVMSLLAANKKE